MAGGGGSVARQQDRPGIEAALWRGLDAFRVLAWAYAAALVWHRHDHLLRAPLAAGVVGVLGLWTVALLVVRRRDERVLAVELALVCAGVLVTMLVETPAARAGGAGTLPALWAASPVMGWAVLRGWRGGLAAALVVGVVDLVQAGRATEGTVYNIVTLVLLGGCLGVCADLGRAAERTLAEALRVQAATTERERLARTIHDGVLQALTFIHRRGEQLGGEAAALGVLAAEQERALRALALGGAPVAVGGPVDVRPNLARLAGERVTVSCPASPVVLDQDRGAELLAAVEAVLANVRVHAGPDARAWVLVEDLGDTLVLTVRDDGVGYAPGRLEEAAGQGRLGVRSSIDGRVRELGGRVQHRSTPGGGTTVQITVPTARPS